MKLKPKDELWACFVNEAGAVGIDQALLARSLPASDGIGGAIVKELSGGCLCCALSNVTSAALVQLIRNTKPDRLIIEPSGLAHPKALLEMLHSEHLKPALDVGPVVCLVDLSTLYLASLESPDDPDNMFAAQVQLADILIGTKLDMATYEQIDIFRSWIKTLHPPKQKYLACTTSEIELLQLGIDPSKKAKMNLPNRSNLEQFSIGGDQPAAAPASLSPTAIGSQSEERKKVWLSNAPDPALITTNNSREPSPGKPVRKESSETTTNAVNTCGWIFHEDDVFNSQAVEKFARAAQPYLLRLKGIFRVGKEPPRWVLLSIAGNVPQEISITSEVLDASEGKDSASDGGREVASLLQELDLAEGDKDSRIEFIVSESGGGKCEGESRNVIEIGEALMKKDWGKVEELLLILLET